jgi:hypothetical protein
MKKESPQKPIRKQNHERISLYGQKPEEMIRAFMQIPLDKILKREEKETVKSR